MPPLPSFVLTHSVFVFGALLVALSVFAELSIRAAFLPARAGSRRRN